MVDDAQQFPSRRLMRWWVLPGPIRVTVVRELGVDGLDGAAAAAAIGLSLRDPESPWGDVVDAATERAWNRDAVGPVLELGLILMPPIRRVVEALVRFGEELGYVPAGRQLCPCMCLCGLHRDSDEGVCLGETDDPVRFEFPGPPLTQLQRTVLMCAPCAEAQRTRLGLRPADR